VVPVFAGIQNLKGGGASNTFRLSDLGSLAGSINGASGTGTGTLDYSSGWSDTVIVDLRTGQASGVAGLAVGAVTNLVNVNGASGGGALGKYNLLIGTGGNILTGGNNRDNLLVAGGSASTLQGGNGVDLLIGGTTNFDTLDVRGQWKSIADYWAATSDDMQTRANKLANVYGLIATGNGGGDTMTGNGAVALFYIDTNDNPTGFDPINS
jgi:hypothetical protein